MVPKTMLMLKQRPYCGFVNMWWWVIRRLKKFGKSLRQLWLSRSSLQAGVCSVQLTCCFTGSESCRNPKSWTVNTQLCFLSPFSVKKSMNMKTFKTDLKICEGFVFAVVSPTLRFLQQVVLINHVLVGHCRTNRLPETTSTHSRTQAESNCMIFLWLWSSGRLVNSWSDKD